MPADRITAEDVVEEARALLRSTIPLRVEASDPDEEMAERAFWESANRLEDLLSRYDAQPKPRWLKPEEVGVVGAYWLYAPYPNPRDGGCVMGPFTVYDGYRVKRDRLFYGPLLKPPPPEGE